MPAPLTTQQLPRHVQDVDTDAGSASNELALRRHVTHSKLPVDSAITDLVRAGAAAIR